MVNDLLEKPGPKLRKYPDDFINKVIQGDCLEVMKDIPDNSIDITVTSPPYNVGMDYGELIDDNKPLQEYVDFLEKVIIELKRITKHSGRVCFNLPAEIKVNLSHKVFISSTVYQIFIDKGFIPMALVTWLESSLSKRTAWGSWMSPSCPAIINPVEYIMVFAKGDRKKVGLKENIDIKKEEFIKWTYGVWEFGNRRKNNHPASFPEELPYRCIKLFSYMGDVVLDPFGGSGTTAVVCKQFNRRSITIELNPEYCNIARKRINNVTKRLDKFDLKTKIGD